MGGAEGTAPLPDEDKTLREPTSPRCWWWWCERRPRCAKEKSAVVSSVMRTTADVSSKMYKRPHGGRGEGIAAPDADVVDADFKEVDDKK